MCNDTYVKNKSDLLKISSSSMEPFTLAQIWQLKASEMMHKFYLLSFYGNQNEEKKRTRNIFTVTKKLPWNIVECWVYVNFSVDGFNEITSSSEIDFPSAEKRDISTVFSALVGDLSKYHFEWKINAAGNKMRKGRVEWWLLGPICVLYILHNAHIFLVRYDMVRGDIKSKEHVK